MFGLPLLFGVQRSSRIFLFFLGHFVSKLRSSGHGKGASASADRVAHFGRHRLLLYFSFSLFHPSNIVLIALIVFGDIFISMALHLHCVVDLSAVVIKNILLLQF